MLSFRSSAVLLQNLASHWPPTILHLSSQGPSAHVIAPLRQGFIPTPLEKSTLHRSHCTYWTIQTFTVEYVYELYIYQHAAARAANRPPEHSSRGDLRPDHQTGNPRRLEECLQRCSSAYAHSFRDPSSSDSTTLPGAGGSERGQRSVAHKQAHHLHSDREHAKP